jgi:hypothetical protein
MIKQGNLFQLNLTIFQFTFQAIPQKLKQASSTKENTSSQWANNLKNFKNT